MGSVKNLSYWLLAVMLLFSSFLVACSSDSGGGSKSELSWVVSTSPVRGEWYKEMVDGFEKENPNITVELIEIPGDDMEQRLSTMLAGGDAPDVWSPNWSRSGFGTYKERDVLLDLTPYMEQDSDFIDGIPDKTLDLYAVDGKYYGLPMLQMGTYIFYNKELFDKAGVDYPTIDWDDESWDWDAFVEKAKQLSQNTDNPNEAIYGAASNETTNRFSWLFGGDFFKKEAYETGVMGEPQAAANPNNKKSIQAKYDLIYKHKVSPSPSQSDALEQMSDPFLSGRVAMMINGGWGVMSYLPAEFEWGFAALPYASEDRQVATFVDPWTISKDSEYPDEAWEFIKYITDPEGGGYQQMVDLNNPPVYDQLKEEYYETIADHENIAMTSDEVREVIQGSLKYGRAPDNHKIAGFTSIRAVMDQTMDGVFNNSTDIDDALEEMDKQLKSLKQ